MTSTLQLQRLAWLALAFLLLILVGIGLLTALPSNALAAEASPSVDSAALSKAVVAMEQLDQMRISLASSLEGRRDRQGQWLAGAPGGHQVRNPYHAPTSAQERQVIDLFHRHPEINGLWKPATSEQGIGLSYDRRINVVPSCMACHGAKASRPAFVRENYPDDKAFNFKVGDLRGMYAVFIPDIQSAPATLVNVSD
jgi:hypothetical protein